MCLSLLNFVYLNHFLTDFQILVRLKELNWMSMWLKVCLYEIWLILASFHRILIFLVDFLSMSI